MKKTLPFLFLFLFACMIGAGLSLFLIENAGACAGCPECQGTCVDIPWGPQEIPSCCKDGCCSGDTQYVLLECVGYCGYGYCNCTKIGCWNGTGCF